MKKIVGIMGQRNANKTDQKNAYEIGAFCADRDWAVLTGGAKFGVLNEALRGAKEHGGLTVGITAADDRNEFSEYIDIPIITKMKSGRNILNAWSSDVVVACGMGAGTASEVSLAIKEGKNVILLGTSEEANTFFKKLAPEQVFVTNNYKEATQKIEEII